MNINAMVEKIELRGGLVPMHPVYDGNTYCLCKSFQCLHITGLMNERTYKKYIDVVLDTQNKIFEYYKHDNTSVTEEDRNAFFSVIWK